MIILRLPLASKPREKQGERRTPTEGEELSSVFESTLLGLLVFHEYRYESRFIPLS
jgi:hypothetical protein